jgi:oxaloacetate decarboxylase gamma subunit
MDGIVGESIKFMILGMGIVYLLLFVIVILTNLQAKIIAKYFPDKPKETSSGGKSAVNSASSEDEEEVVAAIIAAVSKYKNK